MKKRSRKKKKKKRAGGEGTAAAAEEGEEKEESREKKSFRSSGSHCDAPVTADLNVAPPTLSLAKVSGRGRVEGSPQGGGVSEVLLSPAGTDTPQGGGVSEDQRGGVSVGPRSAGRLQVSEDRVCESFR